MKGSVKGLNGSVIGFMFLPVADGVAAAGTAIGGDVAAFCESLGGAC